MMTASDAPVKRRLGRPTVTIKPEHVGDLKSQGLSWRRIAKALRIGTAPPCACLRQLIQRVPILEKGVPKPRSRPNSRLGLLGQLRIASSWLRGSQATFTLVAS
jgi:hypothetical protein